jgi:hypothetical protein
MLKLALICGCLVSFLGAGTSSAGQAPQPTKVRGKIVKVDADKGTLTVRVDDKERQFTISEGTRILVIDIRSYEPKERLKAPVFQSKRLAAVITTMPKDGKDLVKEVIVYTGRK